MTNEIKLILIGILICHQFLFTLAINETECGDLRGCFCEGARGCFFAMNETVHTYTEARGNYVQMEA
ncbi:hypothetical protein Avbf_06578 [Armadillidium vulgare]|nr:hypothetical protein Avbf_06578 [Armadillidium vulgare]